MPKNTRGGDRHTTKARVVRIPDDEWEAAKAKAAERGESMVEVVRRALVQYVEAEGAPAVEP